MQPLMQLESIAWKVLQRGPALTQWSHRQAEAPRIANIVEEAMELQRLDLLITVDTLSAHLAGALGVRTWTLLPAEADWRWMIDRDDTPWYPTMRLFRQPRPGDWCSVIQQVRAAVQSFATKE
jgi:ADP-heptose:LPS heptosyltransferase